jgi:hypothetical protein
LTWGNSEKALNGRPREGGDPVKTRVLTLKGRRDSRSEIAWKIRLIEEMNPEWKDPSD